MNLQQHPLSAAFPAMSADDFQALKDSIEAIGVQNPVTLYEGMVIDGWHRYSAAESLGMECPTVDLGDVDPCDFVLAQNKARRHITQTQLAMAARAVYSWSPPGKPKSAGPADLRQEDIAKKAGVSVRLLRQAAEVEDAAPEVRAALKSGAVGLEKATAIAKLPAEQQAAALSKPAPKPAKKKPAQPANPAPDNSDQLAEAQNAITDLAAENERLTDRLAVEAMDASEEEKTAAAEIIADLRHQVMTLTAELDAMRISRDTFQAENSELMKQVVRNQRELKKLKEGV